MNSGTVTMGTGRDILAADGHLAAVVAVPDGDTMPPPELARDTPVVDVLEPVQVDFVEASRHDLQQIILDGSDSGSGEWHHLDEPLFGNERLNHGVTALAVPQRHSVILLLEDQAEPRQVSHQVFAGFIAILASIGTRFGGHLRIKANDLDARQVVAQADFKVDRIMGRRDFHRACAKGSINGLVRYDGKLTSNDGEDRHAPYHILVTGVFRIDGHSGITQDGLRASGSNVDVFGWLALGQRLQWVAHIGQGSWSIDVIDLQVRKGAHATRTPVDDAFTAVNESLFVKAHEDLTDGL